MCNPNAILMELLATVFMRQPEPGCSKRLQKPGYHPHVCLKMGFRCTWQVYDNVLLGKWVHKQRKMRSTKELPAEHVRCHPTQPSLCECLLFR